MPPSLRLGEGPSLEGGSVGLRTPRPNGGREAKAIWPGHYRFNRFKSLVDKRAGILHHSHIVPRAPVWEATRRLQRGMGGPRSRAGWDLPIRKTPRKEVVQWI